MRESDKRVARGTITKGDSHSGKAKKTEKNAVNCSISSDEIMIVYGPRSTGGGGRGRHHGVGGEARNWRGGGRRTLGAACSLKYRAKKRKVPTGTDVKGNDLWFSGIFLTGWVEA